MIAEEQEEEEEGKIEEEEEEKIEEREEEELKVESGESKGSKLGAEADKEKEERSKPIFSAPLSFSFSLFL